MKANELMKFVKEVYMKRKEDEGRKPLIYISGKMTGAKDYNKPKFDRAKAELESKGYEALSPADLGAEESFEWHDYMRVDIALLAMCDSIYLLDDWRDSKGARAELDVARALKLEVGFQDKLDDLMLWRKGTRGGSMHE